MEFIAEKGEGMIPFVLSQILDTCVSGITLSDPHQKDNPIVYVNEAFELITGYNRDETLGRNCRFLQGDDRDQPSIAKIKQAMDEQKPITVTLRNYRKDGELFYNRLTIKPLFDPQGRLIYFLGIQHDVTNQVDAEEELERLKRLIREADRET
jgi:PAS domain S-box-containing protein